LNLGSKSKNDPDFQVDDIPKKKKTEKTKKIKLDAPLGLRVKMTGATYFELVEKAGTLEAKLHALKNLESEVNSFNVSKMSKLQRSKRSQVAQETDYKVHEEVEELREYWLTKKCEVQLELAWLGVSLNQFGELLNAYVPKGQGKGGISETGLFAPDKEAKKLEKKLLKMGTEGGDNKLHPLVIELAEKYVDILPPYRKMLKHTKEFEDIMKSMKMQLKDFKVIGMEAYKVGKIGPLDLPFFRFGGGNDPRGPGLIPAGIRSVFGMEKKVVTQKRSKEQLSRDIWLMKETASTRSLIFEDITKKLDDLLGEKGLNLEEWKVGYAPPEKGNKNLPGKNAKNQKESVKKRRNSNSK
jgi:hypothetical protein